MAEEYVRKTWQNDVGGKTPINAASLNNIENGIENAIKDISSVKEDILKNILKFPNYTEVLANGKDITDDFNYTAQKNCWVNFYRIEGRPEIYINDTMISGNGYTYDNSTLLIPLRQGQRMSCKYDYSTSSSISYRIVGTY